MLITMLLAAATTEPGPIAKIGATPPTASISSVGKLEDIERCLFDVPGVFTPTVFRQPDKPGQAMLLWMASPSGGGLPVGRVDLETIPTGTKVTIWMPPRKHSERLKACVPEQ